MINVVLDIQEDIEELKANSSGDKHRAIYDRSEISKIESLEELIEYNEKLNDQREFEKLVSSLCLSIYTFCNLPGLCILQTTLKMAILPIYGLSLKTFDKF